MISRYKNFLTDKILESINESYLYYTKDFRSILSKMKKNNIASDLLSSASVDMKGDMTFINLTDKEGYISFSQIKKGISVITKWAKEKGLVKDNGDVSDSVSRIIDLINKGNFDIDDGWSFENDLLTKSRNDIKIGKLVNSLFPGKYTTKEIEEFVGKFKRYALGESDNTFELIEGDAIKSAYLYTNYVSESGTLGNSCMRYTGCQNYFDIYTKNPEVCKLLVLKNEEGEILGRVLVWKFTKIDIEALESAEYFMDRIYTYNDSIISDFKDYSDKNNWIRRTNTGYSDCRTLTYMNDVYNNVGMEVKLSNFSKINEFPYMDTFKRINIEDGILYNDDKELKGSYGLEQTNGEWSSYEGVWSDYYDCYIPDDEATFSRPLSTHIYTDACVWVNIGQQSKRGAYPESYDYIHFDEYREEYIHYDDSIYCHYEELYFFEDDAVDVITNFNGISDFEEERFSDKCNNIVDSNKLDCYEYLKDNDLSGYYYHMELLKARTERTTIPNFTTKYYFKKFEVKVYITDLGNYTKVDCDILEIKDMYRIMDDGGPNNFFTDEFAYNSSIPNKEELKEKCKEKKEHYESILDKLNPEDDVVKESKIKYDYFSERYEELESF